jgi:homoserine kinase type II
MELAVCLSEFIDAAVEQDQIWNRIECFLRGYNSGHRLNENEVDALNSLVKLRFAVIFLHFMGRYMEGMDSVQFMKEHIHRTYEGCKWLNENRVKWDETVHMLIYPQ